MENSDNAVDRSQGKWFVLHALSGHERKACENVLAGLKQQEKALPLYEVLVPMEKVVERRKDGKSATISRMFYPGYVLARMDLYREDGSLNEELWFFIRGIQGIIGFIGDSRHPVPLSQTEIDDILRQCKGPEDGEARPKIEYNIGEHVRIIDGPFTNFEAVIKTIDPESGKLVLEVSIFGRSTPTEAESWQVEREQ